MNNKYLLLCIPFIAVLLSFKGGNLGKLNNSLDSTMYSGVYNEKNLFFENGHSTTDGYCVKKVVVNGKGTKDEINANAFEIDFKQFNLKKGDKILIKVLYKTGCSFKCLNEEVLHQKAK